MKLWRFTLVLITLLESMTQCFSKKELVMVHVIFRHGARYPKHGKLLEKGPERDFLIRKATQLTEVGMRQLFNLGQKIRNDYIIEQHLLKDKYMRHEIDVYSSNVNRTLQSAQSFMYGLYPQDSGHNVPEKVKDDLLIPPYQFTDKERETMSKLPKQFSIPSGLYPFPIHSSGIHGHELNPPCPNKKQMLKQQFDTHFNDIHLEIQQYSAIIQSITANKLHIKGDFSSHNITKIQDIVTSQKYLGVDYGITPQEYSLISYLKGYVKSKYIFTPEYSILTSSPLLESILTNYDNKIAGRTKLKMIVESTHDSLIMPLMVIFELISPERMKKDFEMKTHSSERYPAFASNFVMELYRKVTSSIDEGKDSDYEIKIKFNGHYIKICDAFTCPYDEFKNNMKRILIPPEEYSNKCGVVFDKYEQREEQASNQVMYLIISMGVLIMIIIALISYICKIKKKHSSYDQFHTSGIEL